MQNRVISDGQITASSESRNIYHAKRARLHTTRTDRPGGGWLSHKDDKHQWLQIDLGGVLNVVTGVATQGRDFYHGRVKTYRLAFSDEEANFQYYREQGKTEAKVKSLE